MVADCRFKNGLGGIIFQGSGIQQGPNWLVRNHFTGVEGNAINNYYCSSTWLLGNIAEECTAPATSVHDNGVFWIDTHSASGVSSYDGTHVHYNTVRDCVGNAYFLEEGITSWSNNDALDIQERTSDTYSVTTGGDTYTSDGGHGVLVTGGSDAFAINGGRFEKIEGS